MQVGLVDANGDGIVALRLRGSGGPAQTNAILDTGFSDWLTLSAAQIQALGLAFREGVRYTLADGSESVARAFTAEVFWLGRWKRVIVMEMDGGPLLGMAMLRGCRVVIHAISGGSIEVHPLDRDV